MHEELPYSVYGETVFLGIQDIIIILQIWYYNPSIGTSEKVLVSLVFAGYTLFLFGTKDVLTEVEWDMIISTSTLLNSLSKGRQICTNCYRKSTGQMAFATFFLNWAGSLARFFTVMVEANDDMAFVF